ncbi:glutathione S-transferase N-terminal domain-containing protein [Magnetospirillum gryphiswaldense]|uniref:Glutathione-S-transferase n=1 Tax=Magnetospirillum gryphiswaldense TaxID=55518 RepID=A4TZ95_9PROT|nr:glutathione S-transferase N-terminal domain-containing protein [Magnetospirillum gryphiswaldense]AVM76247.1 Disulfide-bond oxidoreductase YfcG [Magnetospirillum gryphiswaldense MSR-1]AVM80150.1 Disulfide-bond oxidoreductase YfcG [Magnetospirillum gryphiswaldense]CAM75952.1 glutathione-S-transferase [Magnetospirillum gryphiswaldense MSR-1]
MIDLYSWGTPNGRKVSIMLEECGLPYRVHPIDIMKGDQFSPDFIAINPNSKIPAIIDQDGPGGTPFSLFESGAILIYLAEKTGRFLPADARGRSETLQWLMFQMGGIGPMFGQTHHFRKFAPEQIPYAIERYSKETQRLYGVLNGRLGGNKFVAGDYSIADMAIYPWCQRADWQGIDLNAFPHVARWMETMSERPAVERGMSVPG